MNNYRLDRLPVELTHHILSYFAAHEIFYTFKNVSSYLDAILVAYSSYQINFQSITKTNFDLVCQHITPNQVIGLILSNDRNTPGLVECFLSRFQINQFSRLQSLRLIDIGPDFWESIITKLIELKNLCSFSFIDSARNDPWISNLSEIDITQLDRSLFDSYSLLLPQLHRLRLCHGDFLNSTQFPCLRHLILEQTSADIIKHICSVAPQLKSLRTEFQYNPSNTEILYPLTQLHRLALRIKGSTISINDIERMLSNLPRLKHLKLLAPCHNDVINGQRLQIKTKCLVTFTFKFILLISLDSQDLDSFRTSFWLEEKHWFVAYRHRYLYSVPDLSETSANENFELPLYSTVPDNKIFYESIERLDLLEKFNNINHHFTRVQTLTLCYSMLLATVEKIVNLSRVQHLILYPSMENFPIMHIINKMPNLCHISIPIGVNHFLEQVHCETIENIRILKISSRHMDNDNYNVEKLCIVFPKIKHLLVKHTCSISQIFDFLYRFKHLSTASFQYTSRLQNGDDPQQYRLKIQSILDRVRHRQKLNYTYRFACSSVHIWM